MHLLVDVPHEQWKLHTTSVRRGREAEGSSLKDTYLGSGKWPVRH